MNTISFSNAFKSLIATLGAKTTDSNYAVPLVNKTSGAPQGFMDMSNLASVLGVSLSALKSGDNLDDFRRNDGCSYFSSSSTPSGLPSDFPSNQYGLVRCRVMSSAYSIYLQEVFCLNSGERYRRSYWAANGGWKDWYKATDTLVSQ